MTPITPADLEKDGIVHGLAEACARTLREVAAAATAERFVHLAARQVAETSELTVERVAAHIQTTLRALEASKVELAGADSNEPPPVELQKGT